ncbi:MAG: hypothetical protein JWM05_2955, partial [Acidimicrobiales bacterium]|nr:hypothetical protein [Acidimicrobiales bacterium]
AAITPIGSRQGPGGRPSLTVLGLSLLVAAPVLGAGIRMARAGWVPTADDAFIASRSYDVLTSHLPLLGPHSSAGTTGPPVHSTGPMLYWLLALPVRVAPMWALPILVALGNAAALAACIWLAERRGGTGVAWAVAIGSLGLVRAAGPSNLAEVWNPAAGLVPLLLLAMLAWSIADGEHHLLPVAALVGSFALQAHLTYVPPGIGLLLVAAAAPAAAVVVAVRARRARGNRPPEPGDRSVARLLRPFALSGVVIVVCWALPAYEQVTGHPGNLTLVVRANQVDRQLGGAGVAWRATAHALGVPPAFVREEAALGRSTLASFQGHSTGDLVISLVAAAALLAALVDGVRRRDRTVASGAVVAIVLLAAMVATGFRFPRDSFVVALYGFRWFVIVGLFAWVVAGLALWRAVAGRTSAGGADRAARRVAVPAAVALPVAIVVGVALAFALPGRDTSANLYAPAHKLGDALVDATRPGGHYLVGRSGPYDLAFTAVAAYRLRAGGRDPVVTGVDVGAMGRQYRRAGRRCDGIVVLQPAAEPVPPGARTVTEVAAPGFDGAARRLRALLVADAPNGRSC